MGEVEKLLAQFSPEDVRIARAFADRLVFVAKALGAMPSDMMGLWNVPGHPELTSNELLQLWQGNPDA